MRYPTELQMREPQGLSHAQRRAIQLEEDYGTLSNAYILSLLVRARDVIAKEPELLNMEIWCTDETCGTAKCIGGWMDFFFCKDKGIDGPEAQQEYVDILIPHSNRDLGKAFCNLWYWNWHRFSDSKWEPKLEDFCYPEEYPAQYATGEQAVKAINDFIEKYFTEDVIAQDVA